MVTPDPRDSLEDTEALMLVQVNAATQRFLARTLAEVQRQIEETPAGARVSPHLALGVLLGWWTEEISPPITEAVQQAFTTAYSFTYQGGEFVTMATDAMATHVALVRDRLSPTARPDIPEHAFDQVRLALSVATVEGWGIPELSRDIAERLAWEPDKTYWKQQKADAEAAIDTILDPIGPPGTPAREWARRNDQRVLDLQKVRAEAVDVLHEDMGDWQTRALRIARTESTSAWNAGSLAALQSEGVTHKEWLATEDERTRPSHRMADGQVVGISSPFMVGGFALQFPGDPSGPPQEVINCRCTVIGAPTPALNAPRSDLVLTAAAPKRDRRQRRRGRGEISEGESAPIEEREDQIRVPAGNPDGGQWMDTPGKTAEEAEKDIEKAVREAASERGNPATRAEWEKRRGDLRGALRAAAEELRGLKPGTPEYEKATRRLLRVMERANTEIKGMKNPKATDIDRKAAKALIQALDKGAGQLQKYLRTDWSLRDDDGDIGKGDKDLASVPFGLAVDDQLRVPRGNGELSGRWVDGPGAILNQLFGDRLAEVERRADNTPLSIQMQPVTPQLREEFKAKYNKTIPPGWTDVRVDMNDGAELLARGRDAKNVVKSLYSPEYEAKQAAKKYARIREAFEALPQIESSLATIDGDPTKAVARLMLTEGIRVGSTERQRGDVQAYGASTLKREHAEELPNGNIRLAFTAKEGIPAEYEVDDPELVAFLKQRMAETSDPDAPLFETNARNTIDYLREVSGLPDMKNHDLRTLLANRIAMAEVMEEMGNPPPPKNKRELSALKKRVAEVVSGQLRNKPTQALSSYINPAVFLPIITAAGLTAAASPTPSGDEALRALLAEVEYADEDTNAPDPAGMDLTDPDLIEDLIAEARSTSPSDPGFGDLVARTRALLEFMAAENPEDPNVATGLERLALIEDVDWDTGGIDGEGDLLRALTASTWREDQHPRIPQGNGQLSGRFVDSPTVLWQRLSGPAFDLLDQPSPMWTERTPLDAAYKRIWQAHDMDKNDPEGKDFLQQAQTIIRHTASQAESPAVADELVKLADTLDLYTRIDWSLADEDTDLDGGPIDLGPSLVDYSGLPDGGISSHTPYSYEQIMATPNDAKDVYSSINMMMRKVNLNIWFDEETGTIKPDYAALIEKDWPETLAEIQNNPVHVATSLNAALSIFEDREWRDIFDEDVETTFGGYYDPYDPYWMNRAWQEEMFFGTPEQTPLVYGYVPAPSMGEKSTEAEFSPYGPVKFRFKPEVSARSTVTIGDSLNGNLSPIPKSMVGSATPEQIGMSAAHPGTPRHHDYVEAQIYGGLTIDDVEAVVLPRGVQQAWEVMFRIGFDDYSGDAPGQAEVARLLSNRWPEQVEEWEYLLMTLLGEEGGLNVDFY